MSDRVRMTLKTTNLALEGLVLESQPLDDGGEGLVAMRRFLRVMLDSGHDKDVNMWGCAATSAARLSGLTSSSSKYAGPLSMRTPGRTASIDTPSSAHIASYWPTVPLLRLPRKRWADRSVTDHAYPSSWDGCKRTSLGAMCNPRRSSAELCQSLHLRRTRGRVQI